MNRQKKRKAPGNRGVGHFRSVVVNDVSPLIHLCENDDVSLFSINKFGVLSNSSSSSSSFSSSSSSSSLPTTLTFSSSSFVTIAPPTSFLSESTKRNAKSKLQINVRTLPELHLTRDQKNPKQYYINPDLIFYSIILICHNKEKKKNMLSLSSEEMEIAHDSYILVEPAFLLKMSSYFKILLDPKISSNGKKNNNDIGCDSNENENDNNDEEEDEKKILHIHHFSETMVRSTLYMARQVQLMYEMHKNKKEQKKKGYVDEGEEEDEKGIPNNIKEVLESDYELQAYSLDLLIQMAEFAHHYLDFKPLEIRFENLIKFMLKQQSEKNYKKNEGEEEEQEEEEEKKNNFNKLILNIYSSKIYPSSKEAIKKFYIFGKNNNESFEKYLQSRLKETMDSEQKFLFDLFCQCFNRIHKKRIEKWEFRKNLDILYKLRRSNEGCTWKEIFIKNRKKKLFLASKTISEFIYSIYQEYRDVLKHRALHHSDIDDDDDGFDPYSCNKVTRWINILRAIYPDYPQTLLVQEETQNRCNIELFGYLKQI